MMIGYVSLAITLSNECVHARLIWQILLTKIE